MRKYKFVLIVCIIFISSNTFAQDNKRPSDLYDQRPTSLERAEEKKAKERIKENIKVYGIPNPLVPPRKEYNEVVNQDNKEWEPVPTPTVTNPLPAQPVTPPKPEKEPTPKNKNSD